MPITYTVEHARAIIFEHWDGPVTAADLAAHWTRILADPEVMAIRRTVVDLRTATIEFRGPELQALVKNVAAPALAGRQWVTAIVVAAPVHVGVSNQYRVFAEAFSIDEVFHDVEAAARWVLAQPRPS